MTAPLRRWFTPALALVTTLLMVAPFSAPALAAPATPPGPAESDTPLLSEVLEATGRRYLEAKAALDASKKRQAVLATELGKAEAQIEELTPRSPRSPPAPTAPASSAPYRRCSTAPPRTCSCNGRSRWTR